MGETLWHKNHFTVLAVAFVAVFVAQPVLAVPTTAKYYDTGYTKSLDGHSLGAFDLCINKQRTFVLMTSAIISLLLSTLFYLIKVRELNLAKGTTAALKESEERYRAIFEKAAIGIFHRNLDGKITHVNPWICRILGYSSDELTTLSFEDFTHPDDLQVSQQRRQQVIDGKVENCAFDKRYICKDGTIKWVNVTQSRHQNACGSLYLISIVEDITERKSSEERQRELAKHLQEAREQERRRIAREIHDDLGGALTAIKFELSTPRIRQGERDDRAFTTCCPGAITLIDAAVVSMRRIINDLRPSILDDLGLWAALESHVNDFEKRTGICSILRLQGPEPELPYLQATTIFRIVQELLTNVAKHAKANTVEVSVNVAKTEIIIQVEDDGLGVTSDVISRRGAFGLIGICERVECFQGSVKIQGTPHSGTLATVNLPLSALGTI